MSLSLGVAIVALLACWIAEAYRMKMRLRFTIRDLLWLTALVAVCMAWWLDRRNTKSIWPYVDKSGIMSIDSKGQIIFTDREGAKWVRTTQN
jgi:hypothetical protein